VDARLDGLERALVVEVNIGHDRHRDLLQDLAQRLGVLALGHGDAHDVCARCGVALDLAHAVVDLVGVARGHRLHGDGGVAADLHSADAVVTNGHLTGLSTWNHMSRV